MGRVVTLIAGMMFYGLAVGFISTYDIAPPLSGQMSLSGPTLAPGQTTTAFFTPPRAMTMQELSPIIDHVSWHDTRVILASYDAGPNLHPPGFPDQDFWRAPLLVEDLLRDLFCGGKSFRSLPLSWDGI